MPHVCLVKDTDGWMSFPKGVMKHESVLHGAKREWSQDTGMAMDRLQVVHGVYVDEETIGCRYFLAGCEAPRPGSGEPDEKTTVWSPSFEDPSDLHPIERAEWMSLRDVFVCSRLSPYRVGLLLSARAAAKECFLLEEQALRVGTNEAERQSQEEAQRGCQQSRRDSAEASVRRPSKVIDNRFLKGRGQRTIRCDDCQKWFRGNAVGTFMHSKNAPRSEFRKQAWLRNTWDATWYCIRCCGQYWNLTDAKVMKYLRFPERQVQRNEY